MSDIFPDASVKCPYTGFRDGCRDHAMGCPKFVHIVGKDPQSTNTVDHWGCIDSFIGSLMIENSQMQRQTAAEIEQLRNETMRQSAERGLLMRVLQVVQPEHKGELGWFRRTFTSKYLGGRDARDVRC